MLQPLMRTGLALLMLAWGAGTPVAAQSRLKAVASFSILADMLANVGDAAVEISSIVGPETDAHTFQPSPAEARKVAAAAVLVVNGLGFEGWIERLASAAPFKGRRIVASAGVAPMMTAAGGHDHGHAHGSKPTGKTVMDPHCWQDLVCGQRYVTNIAAGLAAADPANAAAYRQRAASYVQRLVELDRWTRAEIARVPADKRKVITGHDAFGYFARAYGVTFLAPAGLSTETEPSARELAALIAQVRQQKIRAIFVENISNPALVEQVARDSGGVVGPKLFVDALSKPDGPAATYEAMFRHNVSALVAGMLKN